MSSIADHGSKSELGLLTPRTEWLAEVEKATARIRTERAQRKPAALSASKRALFEAVYQRIEAGEFK